MAEPTATASSGASRVIAAPPDTLFAAFTDPAALATWQAPDEMTATLHAFDGRVGGGYTMSLHYPPSEPDAPGKTAAREDRYTARFVELTPPTRIVQVIAFETANPAFMGEMTMTITFEERAGGTEVTIAYEHIPPGIRPEDNDAGTRSSLENLARYVEDHAAR